MMPQFMSVEVSAEMIADLMDDDPNFAFEVWETLAERLNMGLMADNLSDLLACNDNPAQSKWIIEQFDSAFSRTAEIYFKDDK